MKIQQFLKKKSQRKLAFSLVELAIVMLIIGILAAAVSKGGEYIQDTRLANARALTNSSPVHSTKDLAVWYDATSEASFAESEADDGAAITTWFDINSQSTKKINATGVNSPKYTADAINNLPAIDFSNSTAYFDLDLNNILGGNTSYTLFVAFRRGASGHLIGSTFSKDTDNEGLGIIFRIVNDRVRYSHQDDSGGNGSREYLTNLGQFSQDDIIIGSVRYSGTNDKLGHCFNTKSCSNTTSFNPPRITSGVGEGFFIGRSNHNGSYNHYNGSLGELIVFNRHLRQDEVVAINEYLAQKWKVDLAS